MKKEKWSEFEKYIVMCDTGKKIKTDSTYSGFLKFLDVKKILELISNNDKSTFIYSGQVYQKPIKQSEAYKALLDIQSQKYNTDIKKVANFMGISI
jgi:hypothetical protein|tara:strand:+ start:701 stop:988 length:288 start_codon:yes stop_codon:yes gene_type:complete